MRPRAALGHGALSAAARNMQTASLLLDAQRDLYQLMAEASTAPEDAAPFRFDVAAA